MCESTAYVKTPKGEDLLLKDVAAIRPEGQKLILRSLLGERVEFDGTIEEIDLMDHKILLKPR
jgi:predicted RNA-binding protein